MLFATIARLRRRCRPPDQQPRRLCASWHIAIDLGGSGYNLPGGLLALASAGDEGKSMQWVLAASTGDYPATPVAAPPELVSRSPFDNPPPASFDTAWPASTRLISAGLTDNAFIRVRGGPRAKYLGTARPRVSWAAPSR